MFSWGNKMDLILKGIFALAIMAGASSSSQHQKLCSGFLPKNDLYIGVNDKSEGGLTKEQFISILKDVKLAYSQVFEVQVGRPLVIYADWEDGEVNAAATIYEGDSILLFTGGLARHPITTMDMFRLVVCHEVGHHLGGAPQADVFTSMASEGQADYYAALRCMKHLLKGQEQVEILDNPQTPKLTLQHCKNTYTTAEEQAVCVRTKLAGLTSGRLMASLKEEDEPSLETPSTEVVTQTTRGYPSTQCRTDTYVAGAFCSKKGGLILDQSTARQNDLCIQNVDLVGFRPNCWFKTSSL